MNPLMGGPPMPPGLMPPGLMPPGLMPPGMMPPGMAPPGLPPGPPGMGGGMPPDPMMGIGGPPGMGGMGGGGGVVGAPFMQPPQVPQEAQPMTLEGILAQLNAGTAQTPIMGVDPGMSMGNPQGQLGIMSLIQSLMGGQSLAGNVAAGQPQYPQFGDPGSFGAY